MSQTPSERLGRTSQTQSRASSKTPSRVGTPRRNRSKTPVRTPTRRRRATLVNASLLTPRRHRTSTTPQNLLRGLSRALVREQVPKTEEADDDLGSNTSEMVHTEEIVKISSLETPPGLKFEKESQFDFDFQPDEIRQDEMDDEIHGKEEEPATPIQSTLFSDIAMPEGIMRDVEDDGEVHSDPFMVGDDTHLSLHMPDLRADVVTKKEKKTPQVRNKLDPLGSRKLMGIAQSYSKRKFAPESQRVLSLISSEFFDQVTNDLSAYTVHAGAKTINLKSSYLLLKRQKVVSSVEELLAVVDRELPMESLQEVKRHVHKL